MYSREDLKLRFSSFGWTPHVEAQEGDYIGEDGYLHCGTCGERKERPFPLNETRMVPVPCFCQRCASYDRDQRLREAADDAKVRQLMSASLVSENFRQATFASFKARSADDERLFRQLRNYCNKFDEMSAAGKGLLLYGPPGTGKTYGAYCIANELMARRLTVFVTSLVRLTNCPDEGFHQRLALMNHARLVVFDDLGVERDTSTKAEQVFETIDARVNSHKPMVITTNITDFKNIRDIAKSRVFDRIAGACLPILVNGESRRREAARTENVSFLAMLGM